MSSSIQSSGIFCYTPQPAPGFALRRKISAELAEINKQICAASLASTLPEPCQKELFAWLKGFSSTIQTNDPLQPIIDKYALKLQELLCNYLAPGAVVEYHALARDLIEWLKKQDGVQVSDNIAIAYQAILEYQKVPLLSEEIQKIQRVREQQQLLKRMMLKEEEKKLQVQLSPLMKLNEQVQEIKRLSSEELDVGLAENLQDAVKETALRRKIKAELAAINNFLANSPLQDKTTKAIRIWHREFKEAIAINVDEREILSEFIKLLQEILVDPIRQKNTEIAMRRNARVMQWKQEQDLARQRKFSKIDAICQDVAKPLVMAGESEARDAEKIIYQIKDLGADDQKNGEELLKEADKLETEIQELNEQTIKLKQKIDSTDSRISETERARAMLQVKINQTRVAIKKKKKSGIKSLATAVAITAACAGATWGLTILMESLAPELTAAPLSSGAKISVGLTF